MTVLTQPSTQVPTARTSTARKITGSARITFAR
jgi:hypothetical protein